MKKILVALILTLTTISSFAQTFTRKNNESAEAFVKHIANTNELAHPVIETKEWDSLKKVIIYFVTDEFELEQVTIGYILIPLDKNIYKRVLLDSFFTEGGSALRTIETVLFANADNDKQREIVVMTRAQAHSPRFTDNYLEGFFYQSFVYDDPAMKVPQKRLPLLPISQKFDQEFEGSIHDAKTGKLIKKETAKYKDAVSIRNALNK